MSKELIENSKAFKALEPHVKKMVIKRANRVQIEDAIIQARNIGVEQWKTQTGICNKWAAIVIEIINNEKKAA